MRNTEHLIPLAEHEQLACIVPDYVQPELAIDNQRLQKLARLGCFSDIRFRLDDTLPTYDTKIVGSTGDAALGAAARVKEAKLSTSDFSNDTDGFHECLPLTITIGREALHEKVEENVRDGNQWRRHLNRAIGGAVTAAAWQHLVKDSSWYERFAGIMLTPGVAIGVHTSNSMYATLMYAVSTTATNFVTTVVQREVPAEDRCYSLVPVLHVDRAFAVGAVAAFKPVIRTIK